MEVYYVLTCVDDYENIEYNWEEFYSWEETIEYASDFLKGNNTGKIQSRYVQIIKPFQIFEDSREGFNLIYDRRELHE